MKKHILIFTVILCSNAFSKCESLPSLRSLFSISASNILNSITTRTAKGGAFKRKELICKKNRCQVIGHEDFQKRYRPNHPDADLNGYVEFPLIDVHTELASATIAAKELLSHPCVKVEVEDKALGFYKISYKIKGRKIVDKFSFNGGQLSFYQTKSLGKLTTINLARYIK